MAAPAYMRHAPSPARSFRTTDWTPPRGLDCSCPEHHENLAELVLPPPNPAIRR
ncbi:hypothetical protein M2302_005246 [Micromonospora sp. A200]|uniref:hypothetical protein n=1 Tax=Micromonospora sp. A200 TaxID=2940568 RepID=UPI0024757D8F|nr:hypothetical protein [Micromonospora sp. A200]MDH6465045.1 hypothetical protein [Micromonospora sp. A200]